MKQLNVRVDYNLSNNVLVDGNKREIESVRFHSALKKPIPRKQETKVDCSQHFKGGWYVTTDGNVRMAVPPHMGVDADNACPKCRGWLSFPKNFSHWRFS